MTNSHNALGEAGKRTIQMHWGLGFFSSYIRKDFFFFFIYRKIERDTTVQLKFYAQDALNNRQYH